MTALTTTTAPPQQAQAADERRDPLARLRSLADAWSAAAAAADAEREHDAAQDLVNVVDELTAGNGHFVFPRGWGMRATGAERGRAFVALAVALGGDEEPGVFSQRLTASAESILPKIGAALWSLADELQLPVSYLIAETIRWRQEM